MYSILFGVVTDCDRLFKETTFGLYVRTTEVNIDAYQTWAKYLTRKNYYFSDIETKGLEIQGNRVVFQIWDTAGQERFRSLLPLYMKGIDGALVVYDVTDKVIFHHTYLSRAMTKPT
jgi:GTPase SAR1 family protein